MSEKVNNIISIGVAHKLAQDASDSGRYDQLRAIWDIVEADQSIIGDANDYHNFAVVLSREDDYLTAYQIVYRGLQQFPFNTDLLADAIYYGSNCKKYEECEEYVKILLERPRSSWTWRAFSFLIDYFKSRWDWNDDPASVESGLEIALEVSKEFQKYLPSEERGYLAEYDIRQSLAKIALDKQNNEEFKKQKDTAVKLLNDTINNGKYSAVKCSLRYADELFEQQDYDAVIQICDKALQFGEETASAKLGYFMYLSAQSREILLYRSDNIKNEDKVNQVYSEYLAALVDTGNSYHRNILRRVNILAARSGIPVPKELINSAKTSIYFGDASE